MLLKQNLSTSLKQRQQPPNSPGLNNLDYHLWGRGHAGKVSQTATEAKDAFRAENRFAAVGRHATGADQQCRQGLH